MSEDRVDARSGERAHRQPAEAPPNSSGIHCGGRRYSANREFIYGCCGDVHLVHKLYRATSPKLVLLRSRVSPSTSR